MSETTPQAPDCEYHLPNFPPDEPIVIDGCGHRHYRQEFHFEGSGFFGRIHAAILNWLRRNSD